MQARVNLATVTGATDPTYAGLVFTGYAGGRWPGLDDNGSKAHAAAWKSLDARYVRVGGRWNGRNIVTGSAGSEAQNIETTLKWFYDNGFRMMFSFVGETDDFNGYSPGNPGKIIARLKTIGAWGDGSRWDLQGPNELNVGGHSMQAMIDRCTAVYDDIQAQAPGKKVWGPVWSAPNSETRSFFRALGPQRCGGIDWHSYPGGAGTHERSIANTLRLASVGGNDVDEVIRVRSMLGEAFPSVGIVVDEMNWSYSHSGSDPAFFTAANTVLFALLYAGILAEGGRVLGYGDQNGALSVMADSFENPSDRPQSSPMPAYWGIAALTGAGLPGNPALFPHYKDKFFATSSDDSLVKLFAVNNEAGSYNIIVINTAQSATKAVSLALSGTTLRTYDLFQTRPAHPYDAPVKLSAGAVITGPISLRLPALSVTVLSLTAAR